jgi:dolichol-phosphate mannosyltransferase
MSLSNRPGLIPRPAPALLSWVIPIYNEENVLPLLRDRLEAVTERLPCPSEIILVDDGSTDRSLDFLLRWASEDERCRVLGLARNFGHQAAATAGLDTAEGDAVVLMDADLQDPPEFVSEMLGRYKEGYDVVYGWRRSRVGESRFKRLSAWLFYRMMRVLIHPDLPKDAGDFRVISRPCLQVLLSMREAHRFLRGMTAWVGFPQVAMEYDRQPRAAGTSKYSLSKMTGLAWNAAFSFSPTPLRVSLLAGVSIALLGLSFGVYAVLRALIVGDTVPGWTTLVIVSSLLGGTVLISNGILGEYVGRIFEELKGRPLYVVSLSANLHSRRPSIGRTSRESNEIGESTKDSRLAQRDSAPSLSKKVP